MGVSHSVAEFTGKIEKTATNVAAAKRPAMNAAALAAKTEMQRGAPTFLRGVGRKGAKIGVRYTLFGDNKAVVRWYGPAHLLNNPTKPHTITPKGRRGRRGGKRALVINGQPVARAQHPGTRGRGFFQKSKPRATREAVNAYNRTVRTAVTSALK